MKLMVYSVYDVKASCYSRPHFLSNDNLALRSFGDAGSIVTGKQIGRAHV